MCTNRSGCIYFFNSDKCCRMLPDWDVVESDHCSSVPTRYTVCESDFSQRQRCFAVSMLWKYSPSRPAQNSVLIQPRNAAYQIWIWFQWICFQRPAKDRIYDKTSGKIANWQELVTLSQIAHSRLAALLWISANFASIEGLAKFLVSFFEFVCTISLAEVFREFLTANG